MSKWAGPYLLVPVVAGTAGGLLGLVDPFRSSLGVINAFGLVSLLPGMGLVGWTVLTVRHAGETLSPVTEPTVLVTTGAFAHTRNPMYLGVVFTVAGVALLAGSPVVAVYAGLLWLTYHVIAVTIEEPKLKQTFGPEYEEYCTQVPRWLFLL